MQNPQYLHYGTLRFFGYSVWWIDDATDYRNIPAHDPVTYTLTRHRFSELGGANPKFPSANATLHYDDACNYQPVVIIGNTAFGLEILD